MVLALMGSIVKISTFHWEKVLVNGKYDVNIIFRMAVVYMYWDCRSSLQTVDASCRTVHSRKKIVASWKNALQRRTSADRHRVVLSFLRAADYAQCIPASDCVFALLYVCNSMLLSKSDDHISFSRHHPAAIVDTCL